MPFLPRGPWPSLSFIRISRRPIVISPGQLISGDNYSVDRDNSNELQLFNAENAPGLLQSVIHHFTLSLYGRLSFSTNIYERFRFSMGVGGANCFDP